MGFLLNKINSFFLKEYIGKDSETYILAKTIVYLNIGIVILISTDLVLTPMTGVQFNILTLINIMSVVFVLLIRAGYYQIVASASVYLYWLLVTVLCFCADANQRFEIYRITSVYLFILLIAELSVKKTSVTFILIGLSVVSVWLYYFARGPQIAIEAGLAPDIDDYIISSFLLALSGFISNYILARNYRLLVGLRKEIKINEKHVDDLMGLQNQLTAIVDSMDSVLILTDIDGNIVTWNSFAQSHANVSLEEAAGKSVFDIFISLKRIKGEITKSLKCNAPCELLKQSRYLDNEQIFENFKVVPVFKTDLFLIRIHDVTKRTKMEETLVQSEKMLSVGGLAAGMAHEINNPLGGILQNSSVLKNRISKELNANIVVADEIGLDMEILEKYVKRRKIDYMLDLIINSGERAALIVKNMLAFSRKADKSREETDIYKLVNSCIELAKTDYNLKKQYDFKQIKINVTADDNLQNVMCEASNISQVILNILRNGAEAMHDAYSKGITLDKPEFNISLFVRDNFFWIKIKDNGPGMDEETRKRVFEPFYTTKDVGVGTGLGLSVSYFIITENHKGEIYVNSILDYGAEFVIKLPL